MHTVDLRHLERVRIVRHSLQTAVTMDIIGAAFDKMSPTVRDVWFPLSKKQAIRKGLPHDPAKQNPPDKYPKADGAKYGSCGFNTEFTLEVLHHLSDGYPFNKIHVSDCVLGFSAKGWNNEVPTLNAQRAAPQRDHGLAIPVGVAVGVYASILSLGIDVTNLLARGIGGACGLGNTQSRISVAIAYLIWSLSETGYFCAEDITSIIELKLGSELLLDTLAFYVENAVEPEFFERVPKDDVANLPHSEAVFALACWYLLRISTQLKEVPFTTVPKEYLPEVFGWQRFGTDLAFLFGVLSTLSEQTGEDGCYKLVIPDALVLDSPYSAEVVSLIKEIA